MSSPDSVTSELSVKSLLLSQPSFLTYKMGIIIATSQG